MDRRRIVAAAAAAGITGALVIAAPSAQAAPGDIEHVSRDDGNQAFEQSVPMQSQDISADGSVLFQAIPQGRGFFGLFVRRPDGTVLRADSDAAGNAASGPGFVGRSAISDDGRYVAFRSESPTFAPIDGRTHIVVKDLQSGVATVVADGGAWSDKCAWSSGNDAIEVADGADVVAFETAAALDPTDTNGVCDIHIWSAATGTAERVTSGDVSQYGLGNSLLALTPDGRRVLYRSDVDSPRTFDLVNGDLWLLDTATGQRTLQSAAADGTPLPHGISRGDVTDDGSLVVFASSDDPTTLAPGLPRAWIRSTAGGAITSLDAPGATTPMYYPVISGDGRVIAADIDWDWLTTGTGGATADVGVYTVADGTWQLASHVLGDPESDGNGQSGSAAVSADGGHVAFQSWATDMVADYPASAARKIFSYEVLLATAPNPDLDGDAILDVVDQDGGTGASPGAFRDTIDASPDTFGTITSKPADMTVSVSDEPDPEGVRVVTTSPSGIGSARISLCGLLSVTVRANTTAVFTCGSVTMRVVDGGPVEADLGNGTLVTIPAGSTTWIDSSGTGYVVDVVAGAPAVISKDGTTATVGVDDPVRTVQPWVFTGFGAPVRNDSLNVVERGDVVALSWTLSSGGSPVTTLRSATATFVPGACSPLRENKVKGSDLKAGKLVVLKGGKYQLGWKAPRTKGCGQLRLDIGDGVLHTAEFRIR
ncbi:MAG: PxKF domain-containing protein [Candidatus Nanopelagicales bacterium]|jgi:hypothetical protein